MKLKIAALITLAMAGGAIACGVFAEGRIVFAGNEVSTDLLLKGGRTYVPLSDVAKALNMTVKKIDGGWLIDLPIEIGGKKAAPGASHSPFSARPASSFALVAPRERQTASRQMSTEISWIV